MQRHSGRPAYDPDRAALFQPSPETVNNQPVEVGKVRPEGTDAVTVEVDVASRPMPNAARCHRRGPHPVYGATRWGAGS